MTRAHVDGERPSDEQIASWVIQWSAVGLRTDLTHIEIEIAKPIMDMAYALSFERNHTRKLESALHEIHSLVDPADLGFRERVLEILQTVMRLP
jgi:hypothetical protein